MTKYIDRAEKTIIAFRISGKSGCPQFTFPLGSVCRICSYYHQAETEVIEIFICTHPQAHGNKRGWLVACPKVEEEK